MTPPAVELSKRQGILEPLLDGHSVAEQVEAVAGAIREHADPPVCLIGHSWGAMLACVVASVHPGLVDQIIMVSSGPLEDSYVGAANQTRTQRLSRAAQSRVRELTHRLDDPNPPDAAKDRALAELGDLLASADAYAPIPHATSHVRVRADVFRAVWPEVVRLRTRGGLVAAAGLVRAPVLAIQGEYDSHPADGVFVPLQREVPDFRSVLLPRCGHVPWFERYGRDPFYAVLRKELE